MDKPQTPPLRFKGFTGDWKEKNLGTVVEIIGGGTPDTTIPEYWNGDIDWYSPSEIGDKVFVNESVRKITALGLQKSSATILPANKTVLFTSRASIGDMAILTKQGTTNQGFQSFVVGPRLNIYFLYSIGFKIKEYALKRASGSTFLEVSKSVLSQMEFLAPQLPEQAQIGDFFRQLDQQIAQARAVWEKSIQLKKAMLAKMFPVSGSLKPEIRFKGFIGDWERKRLGDVATIKTGISNREDSDSTGKYTFFDRSQDVRKSNRYLYDCEAVIMAGEGSEFLPKYFVGKFDLHQRSYAIMDFQECSSLFMFYYLHLMNDYFCNQAVGSTVKSLRLPMFTEMPIILPTTKKEQTQIGNFFRQLDKTIALQAAELEKLNQLKKGLLSVMLV
ncbi:restriction endonuclease subunit S [Neisseria sp. S1]|uniref:restriction endonuclease subunit S n=1 Tax=Neisseria sp. S1 TaxID=3318354 RepID=UPI003A8BACC0